MSSLPHRALLLAVAGLAACTSGEIPPASAATAAGASAAAPGAAAAAGSPAAAPAPAGEGLFDQAAVLAIRAEALAALEAGAGIRLREEVPALLLTAKEALERRKAFAEGLDEHSGVTAGMDWAADLVFSESMLGRYLPDEKVLYIIEDVLERYARDRGAGRDGRGAQARREAEDLLFAIVAHELTHAYDDQVHGALPMPADILELAQAPARLPELQALMTLLEGRAAWAAELASRQAGREPLEMPSVAEAREATALRGRAGDTALQSLGKDVVNTIARLKFVQYAQGREFARRAWKFGGEPFFAQVFAAQPLSLAEIEDFDRFVERWAAELEAKEDAEVAAAEAAGEAAGSPDEPLPPEPAPRRP